MRNLLITFVVVVLSVSFSFSQQQTQSPSTAPQELKEVAIVEQKVMMPMRDGVRLSTDIYRPKGSGKVPVIFSRTPYNFNSYRDGELVTRTMERALEAVKKGYAYVVQNERGRFFSEGEWDILGMPLTDGYDALTWMAAQPWCNGKVALLGCSSTAEWQMAVASMGHPALGTIVPQGYGAGVGRIGNYYEQGNWYRGGAMQMLFTSWLYDTQHDEVKPTLPKNVSQEDLQRIQRFYDMAPRYPKVDWKQAFTYLPIQDIIKNVDGPKGVYEKMIRRKPNDPDWYKGGLYHDNMPFNTPAFWFVSWYDVSTSPNLALYNHVRKNAVDQNVRDNQFLVIAPTLHCGFTRATENTVVGERSVGDARIQNYNEILYGWFDFWLKGEKNNITSTMPRVRYYTMGSNKWQEANTWPPEGATMVTYFLDSQGKANTLNGNGVLKTSKPSKDNPDTFTYDPMNPVPSYGGNVCCTGGAINGGSYDQQEMEKREDILVYTSEPLKEGVEVSGFIETTLYVSSDAKDTDFTVKLIDVYPDGKAYNLDETIQRVRYREGYDKEVFMKEGEVYKVDLTPMSTSNYFDAGHRIRIEISSSNFPRFDRNLNTGGNNFDEKEGKVAKNVVHHSSKFPSMIKIPVVNKKKEVARK